jgi:N-carbamoylputrescine amidase
MRKVAIGVIQTALSKSVDENVREVEARVREAHGKGAQVILPSELFEGPYFPQHERSEYFALAREADGHPTIARFQKLAAELGVVIPVSFFERAGQAFFNSVAVIDADGSNLGVYRKAHIPDGPAYSEKYYFRAGDTGFRVYPTRFGRIGMAICWDQWFPETARALTLLGAEMILYPTAIGSEPAYAEMDTRDPWRRAMIGHAVSNAIPVAASNRIGVEEAMTFYGSSFVADHRGDLLCDLDRSTAGVGVATVDLDAADRYRSEWGFFRDRRPELYGVLCTSDGRPR